MITGSLLGLHLNTIGAVDGFFQRAQPRIAKILLPADPDRVRHLQALSPRTVWIGRIVLDDQPVTPDAGRLLAERTIEAARQFPGVTYWEGENEPDVSSREAVAAYCEHEIARTLTLHRAGLKAAVGGFSTGTPDIALWPFFYPALEYADALHLHEYDAPSMRRLSSWLCGRFVRVYKMLPPELRKPMIISECGVDGGVLGHGRAGWKRYLDASAYMADLAWYDRLMKSHSDRWPILGAAIFCSGGFGWDSYSVDGALLDLLTRYIVSTQKRVTIWRRVIELLERLRERR